MGKSIWEWFDEIIWLSMLEWCLIEVGCDQFHENWFGTIFPNILGLAEYRGTLNVMVIFWFWSLDELKSLE